MLDVKKWIAKVLKALDSTPSWTYVGLVNQVHWSQWECPSDGIIMADIGLQSGGGTWYYYVNDVTEDFAVGKITGSNANGTQHTMVFPVIKGHTYKGVTWSKVNGSALYFRYYQFNKLGGVVNRLLNALTLKRGWVAC